MLLLIPAIAFAQEPEDTAEEPVVADLAQKPWWLKDDDERAAFMETWEVVLPDPPELPEGWEPDRFDALSVPGVPVDVMVPRMPPEVISPWTWLENDASMDVRLGMVDHHRFTQVAFAATEWQPDIEARQIDTDTLMFGGLDREDTELDFRIGEPQIIQHPELGPVMIHNAQIRDNFLERDLFAHSLHFAVEGHGIQVVSISSADLTVAEMVMTDVVSFLTIHDQPLEQDALRYGTVQADAGYSIELPNGWRALTDKEAQRLDRTRLAGEGPFNSKLAKLYVIDVERDQHVGACHASTGDALEVLDPAKSTKAVENFTTYAKVALRGGKVRVITGTEETVTQAVTELPIEVKSSKDVRWVNLGDREAYIWEVQGEAFDEPVSATVFYTTYADVGLLCTAWADEGDEARLHTFEGVVEKLKVTEGEKHPMALTLKGRYTRWWFSANPLLQLYWFPVPLFLIAGWLVVRED